MKVIKFNQMNEALTGFEDDLFKYIYVDGVSIYDMEETQEKFKAYVELSDLKEKLSILFGTKNIEVK